MHVMNSIQFKSLKFKVVNLTIFFVISTQYNISADVLTLTEYIKGTLSKHPAAQFDILEYQKAIKALIGNETIKDWNVFAETSYQKGLSGFGGGYNESGNQIQSNLGVNKIIANTGTRINAKFTQAALTGQPAFRGISFPNQYDATIQIQVVQPLLKNMFGKVDQYPLKRSNIQKKITYLKYNTDLNTFIKAQISSYLDWTYQYQVYQLRQSQYQKAQKQVEITTQQVKKGASELSDLVLIKQNAMAKKMVMEEAKVIYLMKKRHILFNYYGKNTKNNLMKPDQNVRIEAPEVSLWTYIKSKSTIAQIFELEKEIAALTIKTKRNERLPNIDFLASLKGKNLAETSSTLYDDDFSNLEKNFALQLSYPIGNRKLKSEYAQSLITKEEIRFKQQEDWNNIEINVADLASQLQLTLTQIKDVADLLRLSKKLAVLEKKKYKQGRSQSLTFVLNAQNSVLENQIRKLQLIIQKYKLYNEQNALINTYSKAYGGLAQ
tara:strand:+ start:1588 stop:3066 length:1479 start_codon:yes stop_codon:yes gene_type:complete